MSLFCTRHLHASLEEARTCQEEQLRAAADLKLVLAGMPPKPIPRRHFPARRQAKGSVVLWVFSEAAPRGAEAVDVGLQAAAAAVGEEEVVPGARRSAARVPRRGAKEHGRLKPRPKKPRKPKKN